MKANKRKKCLASCPVIRAYPSFFRNPRTHPIKDLLKGQCVSEEDYYIHNLSGLPGLPSLNEFKKMLNGQTFMPFPLEAYIWRDFFDKYGTFWQISGGSPGKLCGRYVRNDFQSIEVVELDF